MDGTARDLGRPRGVRRMVPVRKDHPRRGLRPTNNEVAGPKIGRLRLPYAWYFFFIACFHSCHAASGIYEMASSMRNGSGLASKKPVSTPHKHAVATSPEKAIVKSNHPELRKQRPSSLAKSSRFELCKCSGELDSEPDQVGRHNCIRSDRH